jgi:hypothetical protein
MDVMGFSGVRARLVDGFSIKYLPNKIKIAHHDFGHFEMERTV